MAKPNFRQNVAEEMLKLIEQGTAPWQKPWDANKVRSVAFNPTSNKPYKGMNNFWLEMQGHEDPRWMTYKQAAAIGAQVKKGEKATPIEYWKWSEQKPAFDEDGKPKLDDKGKQVYQTVRLDRPQTFRANVFNGSQIEGLEPFKQPALTFDPVEKAEQLLSDTGVTIKHNQGDRCFYAPMSDEISMVPKEGFENAYDYYAVALHEVGHSTGHESRLDRDFGPKGSEKYAVEELRAEMASYMLTTELGLGHNPGRHAAYVKSWMKAIKADKNILFKAARDAEKITEWVLNKDKRLEMSKGAEMSKSVQEQDKVEKKSFWQKSVGTAMGIFTKKEAVPGEEEISENKEVAPPQQNKVQTKLADEKIILDVPFKEKNAAKEAGAKWDKANKTWFILNNAKGLEKWLPGHEQQQPEIATQSEPKLEEKQALSQNPRFKKGAEATLTDANGMFVTASLKKAALLDDIESQAKKDGYKLFGIDGVIIEALRKGIKPEKEQSNEIGKTSEQAVERSSERQYLNVPFADKNQAKKAGAKWDRKAKSWFAPEGATGLDQWLPENTKEITTTLDPVEEFKQALEDHGLVIKGAPEMDGKWHRAALIDDGKGKQSASYRGFIDGVPNGQIKNFKDGNEAHQWVATGSKLSEAERIELKRQGELRKAERAQELKAQHKQVAKTAFGRIANAKPVMANHPYLEKKGIKPNGLKLHENSNAILVSMQDTSGFIWSTQAISNEGEKRFLKNSRKEGLFHVMGETNLKEAKEFTIVEGVATGASVHEATNKPVIVAFDSGNLKPVAKAIRAINPDAKITIVADNDHAMVRKPTQKKNIGITKAFDAAKAVNGHVIFPRFTKEQKEKGLTDFNDLASDKGLKAVAKALKLSKTKQQSMGA